MSLIFSRITSAVALVVSSAWPVVANAEHRSSEEILAEIENVNSRHDQLIAELEVAKKAAAAREARAASERQAIESALAQVRGETTSASSINISAEHADEGSVATRTSNSPQAARQAAKEGVVTTVVEEPDGKVTTKYSPITPEILAGNSSGKQKFGGIEFGVGFAFTSDLGENDRVSDAEIVNGIVRVNESDNVSARLMLESHYFFTPCRFLMFKTNNCYQGTVLQDSARFGIGPFVSIQPGTEDIIDSIGAGLMVGFRRTPKSTESFNIGVGLLYDINAKILGHGIVEDQPLPVGEDQVRFRTEEQVGLVIVSSYSF